MFTETDIADRPPLFGLTFVLMLLGMPVFLFGGALLRNAVIEGSRAKRTLVDQLLESGSLLAFVGVFVLVGYYPLLAWRRALSMRPYALFVLGAAMTFGPMLYWAWWHGQLPLP